jgi:exosortase/archaeosortase family protein
VFLIFMVPLPYAMETALGFSLQRIAAAAGACMLQIFGLPAFSSGNTILIDDLRIGVVDACNGLGMCYMFLALSVAVAVIVHRPPLDRLLLVAGAIPIALVVNVARIVATGLLHVLAGGRVAHAVYHDLAGWLMMLAALAILYLECRLLAHLFIPIDDELVGRAESGGGIAAGGEPAAARARDSRAIPVLAGAALALVLWPTIVAGNRTGRWRSSEELNAAVARLDGVPTTIGDWAGRTEAVDASAVKIADLAGSLMRRYENSRIGKTITLLLVCGRPGPVSVHNPDICYPGTGFEMAQEQPERLSVPLDPTRDRAEFAWAEFQRHGSVPPQRLRIHWSWKYMGAWSIPFSPRITFGSRPFLYKLYLIQRMSEHDERADDAALMDFLECLLPELDKSLGSQGDGPPRR